MDGAKIMLKTNRLSNMAGNAIVTIEEIVEHETARPITIKAVGPCLIVGATASGYVAGISSDGVTNGWYLGRGGANDDVTLNNYVDGADININTTGAGQVKVNGTPIVSVGEIKQWGGKVVNIPNGWNLADGSKGTVDMTADFKTYGTDTVVYIQYIGA